ncbi:MAG: cation transporter [Vicinamibacterales bacterium]
MMETLTLNVTGMTCGGCESAVKRGLARLDGIGEVTASHAKAKVIVTYDATRVSPDEIKARIGAMGYAVVS